MYLLLADVDNAAIGLIVQGVTAIALLALVIMQGFRIGGGTDGQRQIEPTEMHAVVTELKAQTVTLNKLDREMGETRAGVIAVNDKITTQAQQVENAFRRINAISVESAGVKTRVDGLENREGRRNA